MSLPYVTIREGLVLTKRKNSNNWQAQITRFKGQYLRKSTGESDFDKAKLIAEDLYNQIRYSQKTGQIDVVKSFIDVAKITIKEIRLELLGGIACSSANDYVRAMENYLIPFFQNTLIHTINKSKLLKLDSYRKAKIGRLPSKSVINTHNRALNLVFETAVDKGYMLAIQIPTLINSGQKTKPRPAFNKEEYKKVKAELETFGNTAHRKKTKQIRELLRDYVLILANTGMRCGIESLNLKWSNISKELFDDNLEQLSYSQESIAFAVDGKTGKRELIARNKDNETMNALLRIQSRFDDLKGLPFRELIKVDEYVFRLSSGERPTTENMTKAFRAFLIASDLLADKHGNNRTLYSLRHMYATFNLIDGIDMHTVARQMGTSVSMLEKHYSKLTPQMKAKQLSGVVIPKIKNIDIESPNYETRLQDQLKQQQEQITRLTSAISQLTNALCN